MDDAAEANALFQGLDYDKPLEVAPGITATFRDAGHILGSAIIELRWKGRTARRAGSCSPGTSAGPTRRSCATPRRSIDGADYVLMESTYGGREHEPEDEAIRMLAEAVQAVADTAACC